MALPRPIDAINRFTNETESPPLTLHEPLK
jgi:hypothetical protein